MRRGRGKRYGTPTGAPTPQAIDPASGFKVDLDTLVRQWDGQMISRKFVDIRNPQDFVRGVKDVQTLPFARPEPPDTYIAQPILWEDGVTFITTESGGNDIYQEGVIASDTL